MAVAQRMYARALFEAAQEDGRLDRVAADLGSLADALEQVPELQAFLRNPEVEPAGKSAVLEEITAGADELVRNFVRLVAEKGRPGEIVQIREELDALVARAQNRLALELQTAHELSDAEANVDRRHDREGIRPERRGDPLRRPRPHRRHRPAGRLVPRGRERPRPARAPPPRACHPAVMETPDTAAAKRSHESRIEVHTHSDREAGAFSRDRICAGGFRSCA